MASRRRGSRRRPSDLGVSNNAPHGDEGRIFVPSGPPRARFIDQPPEASFRGSIFPSKNMCDVGGTAEPASAQTLHQQELLDTAKSEESSITSTSLPSPHPGSPFWGRLERDWGLKFYIRIDRGGSFHTYPHVGGPFQSLQEADNAIDRHLHGRRRQARKMFPEQASQMDMMIRKSLYWPDGTIRKRSKSHAIEKSRNATRQFAQALVDNYNEDHNLLGDLAYELKDVVNCQLIYEAPRCYYHFNFTAKTKGADDSDCGVGNLFFAEVKCLHQGEREELVVSCFCMVKPIDNGHCYGCTNIGNVDMKHPNKANAYAGGHLDIHLLLGYTKEWSDSEDDVQAEARVRRMYKGLDNPDSLKKIFKLRPGVTPKRKTKKSN